MLRMGQMSLWRQFYRGLNSKIPTVPVKLPQSSLPEPVEVDPGLLKHLERLSLVNFSNEEAIKRLEEAIHFAQPLEDVNTDGVAPMYTVLEEETLRLRPDLVKQENTREDILKNASVVEEDFFVAPPGNIPLEVSEEKFKKK
eukprot:snap_masked-scaffold821_size92673-processed-gene-0.5 protein:Tk12549 transcript:snap_masked-scaffold821_size92673-processed-gene-0.5-mRNA-1 annotation:"gatc_brafl ame: full"